MRGNAATEPRAAPDSQGKTLHILIIDDDRDHIDLILRAFRQDPEKFRISVAGSVKAARELRDRDPPDLILSDWNLPDGRGIEILTRVDGEVTIPLIVMTGFGDERLAVEIMKSGAIDYVVKSATLFEDMPGLVRRTLRLWENFHERRKAEKAELDSRKRLADILAFLPDPVLAIDTGGTVIAWNNAIERMTGVPAGEMLGRGDYAYSIPFYGEKRPILIDLILQENPGILEKYSNVRQEGDRITSETFIAGLSGGKGAYLWGTASPLYDTAGKRVGAIEVIRDITDRKRAEQIIQASEEKFRSLVEDVPDFIIVHRDGILLFVNRAASEIVEYPVSDLIGRSLMEFIDPADRERVSAAMQKRREMKDVEPYEISIRTRSGQRRQIIVRGSRIEYEGAPASLNVLTDVTEIRRSERDLTMSEERFRELFNNMSSGVAIYEPAPDGKGFIIRNVNHAVERIEQIKKEDIVGKNVLDGFPGIREFGLLSVLEEVAKTGQARRHPVLWYSDNRVSGWRENYVYRLPSGEVVAIYDDVTEKKRAEEALKESEERYRALLYGAGIGVGYWSTEGTLLFLNEISLKRLNGKEEDFIGKSLDDLFGKGDAEKYRERIRRAAASEVPMEYEDRNTLPSGTGWYLSVYTRIAGPDGSIHGVQVLSMDITERKNAEELRKASEIRLDSAMEIGHLAWWEMDLPDGSVRFDDRKATLLGYSPDSFRHYTDFTSLLHPEDLEPAMQAMRDHLSGGTPRYHIDYRIRSANGEYRWFRDVGGITRRHPDGSPATVTGIVIDITANRQAEEALRATETRFGALIQNSSDIIRILDRDGRIVYESPSAERILGYPAESMLGKNPLDFIHPDDTGRIRNDLNDVFGRNNSGTPSEFRIRKADGDYIWVDSIGTNLLDVPGVNGIVITTRPIQERKESERALRESEERLRLALEGADAGFWDWHLPSGNAVFSDRFYTMLGYRPGEFSATYDSWISLMHPDDRERILPVLRQQIQDGRSQLEIEYRIRARDGNWLWILGRGKIVERDGQGEPLRMTGVNIDITSRRLMESEIRSLNAVLEQRVKDRTEALEAENAQRLEAEAKIRASLEEKEMLLKEIHHRVKNNLQIIVSLLNLQARHVRDEQTLAAIRESQNRVKAMALVHEKLYQAEDISHIDLSEYLGFLATGLFHFYDARSRGIRFGPDIQNVQVDINTAIPLGLIINELISNALKYAFPEGRGGEVSVSVRKKDSTLTMIFRDNGIGIPADLDWKNTPSLGLRLVNTLVDQLNGTIELDRSAGTAFTMVLHEKE